MPCGRRRGSRPPRGRDGSRFSRPPDDSSGELNANLTERFGRGSAFKERNGSQKPTEPAYKANAEVQRYFAKRQVGAGAPRWTSRPEIPHPEELVPYPVLPTETQVPDDAAWVMQPDAETSGEWNQAVSADAPWEEQVEAAKAWENTADAWSTQPADGDTSTHQESGDGWGGEASWTGSNNVESSGAWGTSDPWNATPAARPSDAWGLQSKNEEDKEDNDEANSTVAQTEPAASSTSEVPLENPLQPEVPAQGSSKSTVRGDEPAWPTNDQPAEMHNAAEKSKSITRDHVVMTKDSSEHQNEWQNASIETTQEQDDDFESFENVRNIIDGPWSSKMEYLRSHYLLLREDALRPLRKAVEHVRSMSDLNEDPSHATIGIYDQVQVCGITFAKKGIGIRVKFSLGRVGKNIHWAQSKRLMTGTLLVLMSLDKSKCKVATVAARPLELVNKNPPEIDLFFGRREDFDIDCAQDWIMLEERGGFYEAQRHTLTALQRMVTEEFPLQEHLINLETWVHPPKYISENPIRDLRQISRPDYNQGLVRQVNVLEEWPVGFHQQLDESQLNALQTILTKRLSIVQGPPGTGKTFVSVEAIKVILQNLTPGDPPIIITCQTNHALDQLLGHVAKFEDQYVRIGARSSSEEIKKRTLYELKSNRKPAPFRGLQKWRKLESEMEKLIAPLIKGPAGSEKDTFDLELLRELGVLSSQQCDSIIEGAKQWVSHEQDADDRPLLKWIGKQLEPVKPRHQPTLVGYEEVDEGNIGFEEVMEADAEQVILDGDDEMDKLGGTFWQIGDTWTGRAIDNKQSRDTARELLKTKTDLWKIKSNDRGAVYRHIQREAKVKITERLRKLFPEYERACQERKIHRWEHEETILRENKVIGLTTTGVSKYRGLIAALKPKIVLIEEAAETLEAPVIAACMESVEHLILVGDHKQLRPNTHVIELQKPPFNLNISLFERLVNNDVTYSVLSRQRRMKPEIRRILRPIYGDKVKDHSSVKKLDERPPVPGMGGLTTWFYTHEHPDERDQEFSSFNRNEAEMILGLVQYLHYNGISAEHITILTFYNGQRRLIKRLFAQDEKARGNADLSKVQLVTVDSYQGEENEIVILSLVRSNPHGKIGFIGVDNRVCVALSRARRGFYILGNAQMLANESWLWSEVVRLMLNGFVSTSKGDEEKLKTGQRNPGLPKERRLGYTLPLWCERHHRQHWITNSHDWSRNVGGCDLYCGGRLDCGHICPENCHPWPHKMYSCRQPCVKMLACGHPCKHECSTEIHECKHHCVQPTVAPFSPDDNQSSRNASANNPSSSLSPDRCRLDETIELDRSKSNGDRSEMTRPQQRSGFEQRQQQACGHPVTVSDYSSHTSGTRSPFNDSENAAIALAREEIRKEREREHRQATPQRDRGESVTSQESLIPQSQLDDENSRLLFMDDAGQQSIEPKLIDWEQSPDGSIKRRWEVSYTSKPGKKATAKAEAKFFSLIDQ